MSEIFRIFALAFGNWVARADRSAIIKAADIYGYDGESYINNKSNNYDKQRTIRSVLQAAARYAGNDATLVDGSSMRR